MSEVRSSWQKISVLCIFNEDAAVFSVICKDIVPAKHMYFPKGTLCSGIADGYRNKEDAMSACADRSFCKGVIYRYHNNAHGMYYLCRESRLVRTGNHEIAYSKTGQFSGREVRLLGSRI